MGRVGEPAHYDPNLDEGPQVSHFIEKCQYCEKVISQCRCIGRDKIVRFSVCEDCLKLRVAEPIPGTETPTNSTER